MLAIINGRIVTPDGIAEDNLIIDGEKIVGFGEIPNGAVKIYDARGAYIFPGFIDAHTHLEMDLGTTVTADDYKTGTAAALAGGTTTILDFATQERGGTLSNALDAWYGRADDNCSCDYGFHMAVTDLRLALPELPEMIRRGVTSFKAYMAYDNLRLSDDDILRLVLAVRELGGIVGVHCELGDMVNAGVKRELAAGHTSPAYHPMSRPPEVEALAVRNLMDIAKSADAPVWVVHLSTSAGLAEIRKAREDGISVLVETCPQYLTLDESRYSLPGFEGAKYVCSPPLRSFGDIAALWEAVSGGEVNIISTDHCSFNFKGQKELGSGDFSKIPNGLPGIEHRPALIWTAGVSEGCATPEQMAALLSTNPAKAFGMYPRKGALLPGADADVVVWDDAYRGTLTASGQVQNVDYSPWEGTALTGCARAVFLRGELCAENGRVVKEGRGRYIDR